jgi:hypothetical protein
MEIRPFRDSDAPLLAALAASCARGETDFVLNPYWETEDELRSEFERFGIEPGTSAAAVSAASCCEPRSGWVWNGWGSG